ARLASWVREKEQCLFARVRSSTTASSESCVYDGVPRLGYSFVSSASLAVRVVPIPRGSPAWSSIKYASEGRLGRLSCRRGGLRTARVVVTPAATRTAMPSGLNDLDDNTT